MDLWITATNNRLSGASKARIPLYRPLTRAELVEKAIAMGVDRRGIQKKNKVDLIAAMQTIRNAKWEYQTQFIDIALVNERVSESRVGDSEIS
jgi:hypothetical protein